jgi:hypothetical protein
MLTLIVLAVAVILLLLILRGLTHVFHGAAVGLDAVAEDLKKVNRRMAAHARAQPPVLTTTRQVWEAILGFVILCVLIVLAVWIVRAI